jgi:uncharacterized repeat protein (TIGR02543 family)
LTVTADNKTKRTTDADPAFTYSISSGTLIGTDVLSGALARPDLSNAAGSYSIETGTVTVANLGNYNFNVIAGTLTITDKVIPTLYWPSPSSIVYGTLLSNTQLNAEARDGGTTLAGTCLYSPALNAKLAVGTHTLSVTCTPTDSTTYSAVSGTVTIAVTGKPITMKADAKSKIYGDLDPILTETITAGSLESGDSLSGALTRPAGENVGLYAINQGTRGNVNYQITYISDTLTVTAINLTVVVSAPNKQYDRDTDTDLSIGTLTGVISADSGLVTIDASKITGLFTSATAGSSKSINLTINSGVLAGSKQGNYILNTPANPTANITKAPATVTASNRTVVAGNALTAVTYVMTGLVAGDSGDPFTGITCTSDYDPSIDDSTTARYTRCSGGAATNYTPNHVDGIVTIVDSSTATYPVTYSAGSGGGTVPTESDKTTGASFILGSDSGLIKSGYSFAGWSCNSGLTQAAGSSITMPANSLTCVAQWTQNPSGGSDDPNSSKNNTNNRAKKALVVSLVTIAVTPVKANAIVAETKLTPSPTSSQAPGNSETPMNSETAGDGVLKTPKLSEKTVIPTQGMKQISFSGIGMAKVAVVGSVVSIQARSGFSGATTVNITLKDDEEISKITAEVLVLPLPPVSPVATVTSANATRVTWARSPNAIGYEVSQGDDVLCVTTTRNCLISRKLSALPVVMVKSFGKSSTASTTVPATYKVIEVPVAIPEIELVINFDTNKYNLDAGDRAKIESFAKDVARYGYKRVDISGHTDSKGGVDNNLLSLNRARASRDYLLTLVPDLKIEINGFAFAINVASNATPAGMAANRRAEFRVIG